MSDEEPLIQEQMSPSPSYHGSDEDPNDYSKFSESDIELTQRSHEDSREECSDGNLFKKVSKRTVTKKTCVELVEYVTTEVITDADGNLLQKTVIYHKDAPNVVREEEKSESDDEVLSVSSPSASKQSVSSPSGKVGSNFFELILIGCLQIHTNSNHIENRYPEVCVSIALLH